MKEYIKKSAEELLYKVSWPTWDDLQNDSIVVAIASVIIALIIYLMDRFFRYGVGEFYALNKNALFTCLLIGLSVVLCGLLLKKLLTDI